MSIIEKYELKGIREVIADRLDDYANHVLDEYEEEYEGQMTKEPHSDKCYEFGYGDRLNEAVHLIDELIKNKKAKELIDVDVILKSGENNYHYNFISVNFEGFYIVNEPTRSFTDKEIVNAFKMTHSDDIRCQISEFETLEEAIKHATNGMQGLSDILDVNATEALHAMKENNLDIVMYSQFQKNK